MGETIAARVQEVRARVAEAAARAGRKPEEITLVAVTKGVPPAAIEEARALGITDFGENRAQELVEKCAALGESVRWHFIGRLQTNKIKLVGDKIVLLHALDRLPLAEKLENYLAARGRTLPVLLEVNVAREETKAGFYPEEVIPFLQKFSFPHLKVQGLMTVAPYAPDPEEVRPVFRALRELAEKIAALSLPEVEMRFLSMGMSEDFEVAVEEGANIIRVGRAIFGELRRV